jgi:hypothetical protein
MTNIPKYNKGTTWIRKMCNFSLIDKWAQGAFELKI